MMKQLIYKDWLLSRKTTTIAMIYCTLVAVIFLLIRISANCGNLSSDPMFLASIKRNMYMMRYVPCALFFLVLVDNGSISKDLNCGWTRMCRTTAVSTETVVASKLLYNVIVITAAIVPVTIYTIALSIADGSSITFNIIKNIATTYFFSLIISSVYTLFSFILQKQYLVQLIILTFIGIAGAVLTIHLFIKIDELSAEANPDFDLFDFLRTEYAEPLSNIFPIMIIVVLVTFALCFFASVKILKRREMP